MTEIIDAIRAAIEPEATAEARAAGAAGCRAILSSLEPQLPTVQPIVAPEPVAQLATMLRGMNVDQLFDVAIAKLRALEAARPATAQVPRPRPFSIPMVPLPTSK